MRRLLYFSALCIGLLFLCFSVNAQGKTISGNVVSSDDNMPLSDVTVSVMGTDRSTATGSLGDFSIVASPSQTLQFSHVGYADYSVRVGNSTTLTISLKRSEGTMNEVVVTALGIKKERKALGYSVTELGAQELMQNKNTNIVN